MNHQQAQELLPFYIAQTLPAAEQRSVEAHIAQCEVCQQELAEWRSIASAVWSNTDAVASQLPPLSQDVYNRLSYRDKPPRSRYSANPPRPAYTSPAESASPSRPKQPSGRRFALPLTLVAGLLMAVIAGGLLISMTGNQPDRQADEIALNPTQFASPIVIPSRTPLPTDTPNRNQGILPTPLPTGTLLPPAVTSQIPDPAQLPPTETIAGIPPNTGGAIDSQTALSGSAPTATPVGIRRPENSNPLITLTPGVSEDGAPLCYVVNPTDEMLPLRPQASYDDPPEGYILPGDRVRTLVRSADGWYQVLLQEPRRVLWLAPQDAILEGNCLDLWLATPTVSPVPPTDTAADTPLQPIADNLEAVVMASFVDLRAEPRFDAPTVTVVQRGNRLDPVARSGDGQWLLLRLPDERDLWALADTIRLVSRVVPVSTEALTN